MSFSYCYPHQEARFGRVLFDRLNGTAHKFVGKIGALPEKIPGMSDYGGQYLQDHRGVITHSMGVITQLIGEAMRGRAEKVGELVLLDLGAGIGLMSHFAVMMGFKKVIAADIFEPSVRDAAVLGSALGLNPQAMLVGDFDAVEAQLGAEGRAIDAMVLADVIEHIYDVPRFFDRLEQFGSSRFRAIMSTVSNRMNPAILRTLRRKQRNVELVDREPPPGHKPSDSLKSYRRVRMEIVEEHAGGRLNASQVNRLAGLTRGLMKQDIIAAVDAFLTTGREPRPIEDPTDTCDPLTGNWCEHLHHPPQLANDLQRRGFETTLLPQVYALKGNGSVSDRVKSAINAVAARAGDRGLHLARGYCIVAERQ